MSESVPGLVEHLFRHEAGKLLSSLGRRLGPAHLDLAEEAVQDAIVRALKVWPYQGVPPNPAAWLAKTAQNLAIDKLRRHSIANRVHEQIAHHLPVESLSVETDASERMDDQLAMMFATCHPQLSQKAQTALTLKAVCGFSTGEIGRAFLAEEAIIAQRIVRAKKLLREENIAIAVPMAAELPERLDAVLHVLYLLFNEGYSAHSGDELVRHDLCEEALRLGRLITQRYELAQPKVHALVALMFFHASRLPARVDGAGDLLRLADQDRGKWDQRFVFAGLRHIDAASEGEELSTYHLEAGIAAIHAQASSDDDTDWPRILWLYDRLCDRSPNPVAKLNRAVAVMRVHGAERGLVELKPLVLNLDRYYLFHSVHGDFLRRLDRLVEARAAYEIALGCPCCEPERRFLRRQIQALN